MRPSAGPSSGTPSGLTTTGLDAEIGFRGHARLVRDGAGKGYEQHRARFRLPVGIDDRAAPAADLGMKPAPGFGVDGFADGAEHAQARQVMFAHRGCRLAHQRAQSGRRGIEDVHPVLLDDRPPAGSVRPVRDALEHDARGAVQERSVNLVAVRGHPAHIGGGPEHIALVPIEDRSPGRANLDEIATGRVHETFGFAGRTRCIEDEEGILGVHFHRFAPRSGGSDCLIVPDVAAWRNGTFRPVLAHNDHDARCLAELANAASAFSSRGAVRPPRWPSSRGDQHLGWVRDAACERLWRETGKHHGMHRADAHAAIIATMTSGMTGR